eukprot:3197523-Pyramimonas_sp.AAC.1
MARWWLQSDCSVTQTCPSVPDIFPLKGRCAHMSHHIEWSRKEQGHFCWTCGALTKHYVSEKLAGECNPPAEKTKGHYV